MSCKDALSKIRDVIINPPDLAELWELSQKERHGGMRALSQKEPDGGMVALYLGARLISNEQIKIQIDDALDREIQDAMHHYGGHPEMQLLQHAHNTLRDHAEEGDYQAAAEHFKTYLERPDAAEKFPHLHLLEVVAQLKLAQLRSISSRAHTEGRDELEAIAARMQASPLVQRLNARFQARTKTA